MTETLTQDIINKNVIIIHSDGTSKTAAEIAHEKHLIRSVLESAEKGELIEWLHRFELETTATTLETESQRLEELATSALTDVDEATHSSMERYWEGAQDAAENSWGRLRAKANTIRNILNK